MFEAWTCPDSYDTPVPLGEYDLRVHVDGWSPEDRFQTARVRVTELGKTIRDLDNKLTVAYGQNPATIIGIRLVPEMDSVTLTREEYQTLLMLAHRGAAGVQHTSQLWIRVNSRRLNDIEEAHR
jgi:hypothetical protein